MGDVNPYFHFELQLRFFGSSPSSIFMGCERDAAAAGSRSAAHQGTSLSRFGWHRSCINERGKAALPAWRSSSKGRLRPL